ncbi:MAG: TonB-dependent receptor plug domain-containing protein, partial [Oceanicaulis sp.]
MALTAWAPAPAVFAQDENVEVTDTITITARKRDETLENAPVTVTAFNDAAIEARGLTDIEDVSRFSPGFFFTPQGSQRGGRSESVIRFRGMDINDVSPTQQLASVFMDGVYVSGGVASIGFEDVERIEVIKGPQSAYFGRSTFGGAVNFITRDPADTLGLRSRIEVAEGETLDARASIEGPILGDAVRA